VVVVYDVTAPATLEDAAAWGQEVAKHCRQAPQPGEGAVLERHSKFVVGRETCHQFACSEACVRVAASMWQL
jgi:hypothetical protein